MLARLRSGSVALVLPSVSTVPQGAPYPDIVSDFFSRVIERWGAGCEGVGGSIGRTYTAGPKKQFEKKFWRKILVRVKEGTVKLAPAHTDCPFFTHASLVEQIPHPHLQRRGQRLCRVQ